MKKLKILIAARTSWHLRDMVESGTLDKLKKEFNLSFIYFDKKISTANEKEEYNLSSYGDFNVYPKKLPEWIVKKETGIKKKFQTLRRIFRPSINHIAYFLNQLNFNKRYIQKKNLYGELHLSLFNFEIKLIKTFIFLKIDFLVVKILKFFLRLTAPNIIPRDKNYDLALVCYNSFNAFGYIDDFLRDARKIDLKTFGLQMDLDNLISRRPLEVPDFLGVWGMQTFTWCINSHKIPTYKLALIGTPRVDLLKKDLPSKEESKTFLKIPLHSKVLLFCPASRNHDENYILHTFQSGVDKGFFPQNTYIFFKDHSGKIYIKEALDTYKIRDKEKLKNIIFWSDIDDKFYNNIATPLDIYRYFYGACEATISPLSTMHVEAMLLGIPALCYTYTLDEKLHSHELKMDRYKHRIYHYPSLRSDCIVLCEGRKNINNDIKAILEKSKNPEISNLCKLTATHGIYTGKKLASDRIVENIYKIFEKGPLDESYKYYE